MEIIKKQKQLLSAICTSQKLFIFPGQTIGGKAMLLLFPAVSAPSDNQLMVPLPCLLLQAPCILFLLTLSALSIGCFLTRRANIIAIKNKKRISAQRTKNNLNENTSPSSDPIKCSHRSEISIAFCNRVETFLTVVIASPLVWIQSK